MSEESRAALAGEFENSGTADCQILFYVPAASVNVSLEEQGPTSRRQRLGDSALSSSQHYVSQSLPAHRHILCTSSERFRAQLSACWGFRVAPVGTAAGPPLPTLMVPLGSEAELPAARTAIRYMYTGRFGEASSWPEPSTSSRGGGMTIAELLAVRRQASYLQVGGCVAACDQEVTALQGGGGFGFPAAEEGGSGSAAGRQGAAGSTGNSTGPPVLQLFADPALLPWEEEEPGRFKDVLAAAKRALVAHFKSAPVVLKSPRRQRQLNSLPAAGLELLLAADEFATDDESSVLLLLAKWREANLESVTEEEMGRLCGLVRVVQLGPAYLHYVLPELDWFPISRREHLQAVHYAAGSSVLRSGMQAQQDLSSPWFSQPRARAYPPKGITYVKWSIGREDLLNLYAEHAELEETNTVGCSVPFQWFSHGFSLGVCIYLRPGTQAAELRLQCILPPVFRGLPIKGVAMLSVRVSFHRWRQGDCEVSQTVRLDDSVLPIGTYNVTRPSAVISLRVPAPGDAAAAAAAAADPLWRWGEYMHEGKINGHFTYHIGSSPC